MQLSRNDIKLLRPVPAPKKFQAKESWVEGDFVLRLDPDLGVVKRSPVTRGTSVGTMYFEVEYIEKQPKRRSIFGKRDVEPKPTPPKPKLQPKAVALKSAPSSRQFKNTSSKINKTKSKRVNPKRFAIASIAAVAIVAIAVLLYPVFPELKYRIYSTTPAAKADAVNVSVQEKPIDGNRLWIPKIGVDTPIVEGSDLTILDSEEGVWHQTGGYGYGNFVLAGHRFKYLPPNTTTLYNLDKLEAGDTLAVDWKGKREIFEVEKKLKVNAKDLSILNPTFQQTITIYTCSDKQETERIVIRAKPAAAR